MPEVRIDPLTGLKAIHAEHRDAALVADAAAPQARAARQLLHAARAAGTQEVVPAPRGARSLHDLGADGLAEALEAWREGLRHHAGAAYAHLFVDDDSADAHLLALPFVPAQVARERERFAAYAAANYGANLLEDLVREEVKLGERLVAVDDEAVVLAAWAARVPYELLVVPRRPRARFEDEGALGAGALAGALGRLAAVHGAPPPVTAWVRTAPRGAEHFCWHIDVLPRTTPLTGLELGTGVHLSVVSPERAAAELREV